MNVENCDGCLVLYPEPFETFTYNRTSTLMFVPSHLVLPPGCFACDYCALDGCEVCGDVSCHDAVYIDVNKIPVGVNKAVIETHLSRTVALDKSPTINLKRKHK